MKIKGFLGTSLIDYPQQIAAVVFFGGCNFRCPFCHNSHLVFDDDPLSENISQDFVLAALDKRKKFIDAVVLTGGEALLQKNLVSFIQQIKILAPYKIKLDTNGFLVQRLHDVLQTDYIDYIAMDIKSHWSGYDYATGVNLEKSLLQQRISASIKQIVDSGVDHEFRTTVVPGIVGEADILAIAQELPEHSPYFIQQFVNTNTLDKRYANITSYTSQQMQSFLALARSKHALSFLRV